jgi:hypothetical protein
MSEVRCCGLCNLMNAMAVGQKMAEGGHKMALE